MLCTMLLWKLMLTYMRVTWYLNSTIILHPFVVLTILEYTYLSCMFCCVSQHILSNLFMHALHFYCFIFTTVGCLIDDFKILCCLLPCWFCPSSCMFTSITVAYLLFVTCSSSMKPIHLLVGCLGTLLRHAICNSFDYHSRMQFKYSYLVHCILIEFCSLELFIHEFRYGNVCLHLCHDGAPNLSLDLYKCYTIYCLLYTYFDVMLPMLVHKVQ